MRDLLKTTVPADFLDDPDTVFDLPNNRLVNTRTGVVYENLTIKVDDLRRVMFEMGEELHPDDLKKLFNT